MGLQADFGFGAWSGTPEPMPAPHLHPEVEINLVDEGEAVYDLAGRSLTVPPGRLCAFWGALPHRLRACRGVVTMRWVTVPLREALAMRLDADATRALLSGEPLCGPADPGQAALDRAQLARWAEQHRERRWRAQVLDEIAARLRRLAIAWSASRPAAATPSARALPLAARAARVIAERYHQPLSIAAVAEACAVHPKHLSAAFRSATGMPPQAYLVRMRLAHAQYLLRDSARAVADIALDSGFGSQNAFYHAFRTQLGTTPSAWREHGRSGHGAG